MGNENEIIKVFMSALEDRRVIVLDYDERIDGPYNHLDPYNMIRGNDLTYFSSL